VNRTGVRLAGAHRTLIGIVIAGVVVIAGIGFAGSYTAVRTLAARKGFGAFAGVFPIGVDAGIVVLLTLDLLLAWLRIPFPLLRPAAWLLTAATIVFNGAAAGADPLGAGMHAVIPVLFVVAVEAARHTVGRTADITAGRHMEPVRITRWILAPLPTFRLWRHMKLWELRSYEEAIRREQDRLVYRARLRARYGIAWRHRASVEALLPLRLARYGVPLTETIAGTAGHVDDDQAVTETIAGQQAEDDAGTGQPATAPGHDVTGPDGHRAPVVEGVTGAPLTEAERVALIIGWLTEAEATGVPVSGAEAARRLGVAPSTGQRDMRQARRLLAQGSTPAPPARLRSVTAGRGRDVDRRHLPGPGTASGT
jgi:Protein of unknown function (DUF2637)